MKQKGGAGDGVRQRCFGSWRLLRKDKRGVAKKLSGKVQFLLGVTST